MLDEEREKYEMKDRILIVEDDRVTSLIIQKYIEELGYETAGAVSSGEEAIIYSKNVSPDLILMDITLEGEMDGIDSANHIYSEFNIPIVYITTSSDDSTMKRAKEANPFGFIIKPIDKKELRASLELALLRYRMDEKLIENEEKYFNILASIGDAVIVTDYDGNITYINPVAEKMTGYKLSEVAGLYAQHLINVENVEVKQPAITNNDDSDIRNRSYLISKDNSKTPVDYRSSPQKDRNGDYIGTVVVLRDITESVKSEDKLHESFKMLRKAMGGAIQAMAQTVESRDPYTAGHQKRVSNIARMIADELSLKRDQIEGIRLAGVIHDLGKISIPAEILSKPGRITEVEFNLIKNHPQTGYDILKTIDFPWPIAEIVYQHHERIDGSGYPRGLTGDEIMIEAKILAVADVVEAMASHRPYRPSLGIDVALEEIEKNRGKLYDEEIADVCIDIFRKKKIDIEAIR